MVKQSSPTQKMLFWWGIILIIWSAYRFKFGTDLGIYFDEFVAKPLVFILPVIIYIRKVEKQSLTAGLALKSKELGQDIFLGLCTAAALLFVLYLNVPLKILATNFSKITTTQNIVLVILTAFATSISEELLSRGFVLKRLFAESQNIITSSFFASILFFFLRVPILFSNGKIMGTTLLAMMMMEILFSFAVSIVFLKRKSVVLPVLIHAFYILALYLYLGFS